MLQLYLELCGDEAMRRARWGQVARTLLLRSASAHFDPTEVFEELALTKEERRRFRWGCCMYGPMVAARALNSSASS